MYFIVVWILQGVLPPSYLNNFKKSLCYPLASYEWGAWFRIEGAPKGIVYLDILIACFPLSSDHGHIFSPGLKSKG